MPPPEHPITVAIVEDNAGIRQEFQHLIARYPDLTCVGACRNASNALATLPAAAPEVVLMDIQLPDRSGIECTGRLKSLLPRTHILMFTICEESESILQALSAGAVGYILKSSPPDDIVAAIREAHRGGAPLTGLVARKVVENFHQSSPRTLEVEQLTSREKEVLQLLSRGCIDKQIANQLAISLQTVNSHLKHIYAKLGVRSRTEAVIKFIHV